MLCIKPLDDIEEWDDLWMRDQTPAAICIALAIITTHCVHCDLVSPGIFILYSP